MSLVYRAVSSPGARGRRNSIFVGGKVDAKNREWLEQRGITHILNVTPQKEAGIKAGVPNFFESSGKFKYKRIAVYDASTTDLLSHADTTIVPFLSTALLHGSVLVHCQQGVSRSATSVAFYLMRKAGMTLAQAMAVMTEKRPTINPIPAFVQQLKEYEMKCIALGVIGNNDTGITTKRKLAIGSIGPAMPPAENHFAVQEEGNKRRKQQRIGPSISPTAKTIGPAMPPQTTTAIGPAMPPCVKDDDVGETVGANHSRIGPSLPPSKEVPAMKKSIGPALPPGVVLGDTD